MKLAAAVAEAFRGLEATSVVEGLQPGVEVVRRVHDVLASVATVLDRHQIVVVSDREDPDDAPDGTMRQVVGDDPDAALFQLAPPR